MWHKLFEIFKGKQKGFTFIELAIAIAITGSLAAGTAAATANLYKGTKAVQTNSKLVYNVAVATPTNIPNITMPSISSRYLIGGSAGTGGTISPSGTTQLNWGANQTFTISPNQGYSIASVLVDGASVGAVSTYSFTNVTANHTISCSFSQNQYTINVSAGAGGTISPSNAVILNWGGNQTFTITPSGGYAIASVLVDGSSVGTVSTYSFTSVTANHTISCSFTQNQQTINAIAGTGGTISPTGTIILNWGGNQTFTIIPNSGYSIADVLVDGSSVGAVSTYSFINVTANHTISCSFTPSSQSILNDAVTSLNGTIGICVSNIQLQSDPANPALGNIYAHGNINILASNGAISGTATATGSVSKTGNVTIANQQSNFSPPITFNLPNTTTYLSQANAGGSTGSINITSNNITYNIGPKHVTGNLTITGSNVVLQLNGTVWVDGNININASGCEIKGPGTIVAGGNIQITAGAVQNQSSSTIPMIIANTGTITVTTSSATLSAILYAPQNSITLTGSTGTIYGAIIGKSVSITYGTINITYPVALQNKSY